MRLGKKADFERELVKATADARTMRVWHCGVDSFQFLARFRQLETLLVASWTDADFEPLKTLERLQRFEVVHLPKITCLDSFPRMTNLRQLKLAILPSEIPKLRRVESWKPLDRLCSLETLQIEGFRPDRDGVVALAEITTLRSLYIDDIYPLSELATLSAALPQLRCELFNHASQTDTRCEKECGGFSMRLHRLSPKRGQAWVCTVCDRVRVAEHAEQWRELFKPG